MYDIYQHATGILQARGYRLTRPRQVILEILLNSQEHLDAETLYDLARTKDRDISLATIYRSLALLKDAGLVQENHLGEGHGHFETKPEDPHYHFTCVKCGRVIEFAAREVTEAVGDFCQRHGVQITQVQLNLSGYCSECRQPAENCHEGL